MRIAFTILGAPVSHKNGYHIVMLGKKPSLAKSKEAREWEKSALLQIPAPARQRLEGPVRVWLRLVYTSERPDMDESLVLDIMQDQWGKLFREPVDRASAGQSRPLLQAGVYRNDRQVRDKRVIFAKDAQNPRVDVVVEALQPQQTGLDLAGGELFPPLPF